MITLYSNNCPTCNTVAALLRDKGLRYEYRAAADYLEFLKEQGVRSMPAMLTEDGVVYEGADCLVAIKEGELCN